HEATVAAAALTLGARQRVLLAGVRMQEHREIAPHRAEAGVEHLLRGGTYHHPVAVAGRLAQQFVADRAADKIDLKARHRTAARIGAAAAGPVIAWPARPGRRSPCACPR